MKSIDRLWETIVGLMDDETREMVHFNIAPCTNEEFLAAYLEADPDFSITLNQLGVDED